MLRELYIEQFAIIDSLRVSLAPGMNVLSGETGAGKSIIVGAVSLLLGDRASNDLIRSSRDAAVVEASFDVSENDEVREKLVALDMEGDGDLVIRRVISRTGKNRILINGRLATAGMLASISESLVTICGQHEHQSLLRRETHIDILDAFAGLLGQRTEYVRRYEEYRELRQREEDMLAAREDRRSREELLEFQLTEIEKSGVRTGEDRELSDEKRLLANAHKRRTCADESYHALYGREGSLLEELDRVRTLLGEIRDLDPAFSINDATMDAMYYGLEDAALTLRDYLGGINHDPRRLDEINDRLELLGVLKRKYGGSVEAVLERKQSIIEELDGIQTLDHSLGDLKDTIARVEKDLTERAEHLSRGRIEAARNLERAIAGELADLRMAGARFSVRCDRERGDTLREKGFDQVEFLLSANKGESLKPLNRVASGGELSRIVLALKTALVQGASTETVIFDEVDSGIGGAAAQVVGSKLKDISRRQQVVCITHLPQIASFGDVHFLVTKGEAGDVAQAAIRELGSDERPEEIARMLGGVTLTEKTREHAREMLRGSQKL